MAFPRTPGVDRPRTLLSMRAVLFDMDGTLVDTIGRWVGAYLATLADHDVLWSEAEFLERVYARNRPVGTVLAELGIEDEAAFRARRDDHYCELLRGAELWLPGAREALRRMRPRPVGIVTTAWRRYYDVIDETHGLSGLVDAVVTIDAAPGRGKPDPTTLLLGAEQLGVAPEDCLYVGDQPFDVDGARNAGMRSCLVPQAHTPPGLTADLVVRSLDELAV